MLARQPGFSLHTATCCEASQRDRLEKLCRYIIRPAIANERLSTNERGQIRMPMDCISGLFPSANPGTSIQYHQSRAKIPIILPIRLLSGLTYLVIILAVWLGNATIRNLRQQHQ